jgi:hypothetical protein
LKIGYGGWPGGPAPYGYRIVRIDSGSGRSRKKLSVLVTDEYESRVLTVAVALVVDSGLNISGAAVELNKRGLLTRSGVPWTAANLRGRLYAETIHEGHVVYRKVGTPGRVGTRVGADGAPVHGEPVRIAVPAIFTEERARQLLIALRRIGFRNGRRGAQEYPLSGRIVGRCGEVYVGAGRSAQRSYRCNGVLRTPSCREPYFEASGIELLVWNELSGLVGGVDSARRAAAGPSDEPIGPVGQYEQRLTDFNAKIARQEDLIERKVPEYLSAGVDPNLLAAAVAKMQEELCELRRQRAVAEARLAERGSAFGGAIDFADLARGSREHLDGIPLAALKEIFSAYDVMAHPAAMKRALKPGVRCPVTEWHRESGTLIPLDPSQEEWDEVLGVLRAFFPRRHFISTYDIRQQFAAMLHRLRHGLSWADLRPAWGEPNAIRERQLSWWKKGAWPQVMSALRANELGTPLYQPAVFPQISVFGRFAVEPIDFR